ncbi:hypothetical protein [Umezawaea beigongshangensis]|uniref:hypothetical protein n=1 Tax=Umezawaea beigongshangensis TaxID=2780383 RepID=UPI0018F1C040|nr:hypothetical protein [Umezawaea beigongshangensis]
MRRSPQEKKRLSFEKDCRNTYGENAGSSRKNVPRSRKRAHRAERRRVDLLLHAATGSPDRENADHVEQLLAARRPPAFRKVPDVPLGVVVEGQLRRRVRAGIDHETRAAVRVRRVRVRRRVPVDPVPDAG